MPSARSGTSRIPPAPGPATTRSGSGGVAYAVIAALLNLLDAALMTTGPVRCLDVR
ncbi:hypothetical protein [Streptomyces sp. NPDC017991]|uniref:hypothetical protein n=1 Tax=Streptomyces sp. NPDC017991 TaxID=3365026 RepID=UPI00379BDC83